MNVGHSPRLELLGDPGSSAEARSLITEYVGWVSGVARERYGLEFDVDAMIATDVGPSSQFRPPAGRLYLARLGAMAAGIGGVRLTAPGEAELLRMYVRPEARGRGIGRLLLARLVDDACEMGAHTVRLESLRALEAAHGLYRSAGFHDIEPYSAHAMSDFQPEADMDRFCESVVFMEVSL